MAGLLVSIKPAVHMAPLYTRSLFQAMTGQWDGVVSELDRELTEADLMYWKEHLPSMRGKSWTRRKGWGRLRQGLYRQVLVAAR